MKLTFGEGSKVMKVKKSIGNKYVILIALSLALGITLEINPISVKAGTNLDNTETTTETTNDESSYFTDLIGDPNEKIDDDGNVTATLNYDGHTYPVTGKAGQKVLVKSSDGNYAYISINKNTVQNFSDGAEVSVKDKSKLYDQYGGITNYGVAEGSTEKVDQKIITNENKIYYHLVDDQIDGGSGLWIEQSDGVSLTNGNLTGDTKTFMSYGILERYAPTTDFTTKKDPTISGDSVNGEISVHSKNYNTDFEYSYSGIPGETVNAVMENKNAKDYPNAPKVKVKISSVVINSISSTSQVNLAGPSTRTYRTYDDNGVGASMYCAGDTNSNTNAVMKIGDNTFYRIGIDEWLKQSPGVTLEQKGVATPTKQNNISVYVDEPVVADVSIPSNEEAKIVKDQTGEIGDELNVTVPAVSGMTPDKSTIKALVNPDRTITALEKVTYTKKSTSSGSHSSGSSSDNELGYGYLNQTVSTYSNKGPAKLYSLSGKSFTPITNKALAPDTGWFTDQMITYNNKRYYRVATNEWVRSTESYVYEDNPMSLNVEKQTSLINAEDEKITNRALGANTSWHVDRIAYLGDYQKPITAYRVATNEFVLKDK